MAKVQINGSWWRKIIILGFATFIGWMIGIPLLIYGVIASISALMISGLVLIITTFFCGIIGSIIVYISNVKKYAREKEKNQTENSTSDPIEHPTKLTYRQRGLKQRGDYAADVLADSINAYKVLPKKEKISTLLVLIIFGFGVALFITGLILLVLKIQPLGYIAMFLGFGLGAGILIVMGLIKSLPERLKVKRLMKNPKHVRVYEKEAIVLQSLKHSSRERIVKYNYSVFDIVYIVYLDCSGKTVSTCSLNYYKKGAKVKIYIDAANPKNVYIENENLIFPIIIKK